jgi:NAD(P)-dependent dehydrogenase (short-subunit alcohol dehydrogenase family)
MTAVGLTSLPRPYRALVIGAQGALGRAFVDHLRQDPACECLAVTARDPAVCRSEPANGIDAWVPMDLCDEASVQAAMSELQGHGPFHLVINATGVLTLDGIAPEKRLADLDPAHMARIFAINTTGPALLLKHGVALLPPKGRCVVATLSARVGSIGDNRKGGWYSYRASKAALNMVWRTAAIEVARRRPEAVLLALHPGTVFSPLSAPFVAEGDERPGLMRPENAAARLLAVMDGASESGSFKAWDGQPIEW